ncbi:DUF1700 domain-containing protein [Undibacterium sp.]|uniref:DUF1700 domain-containing protein n=1 Tax=Undibacterium sp. TaxID=1914977 RepID=UPI003753260A
MNKTEYMNTLRQELQGLPTTLINDTVAYCEKQFAEGLALGKTEHEITEKLTNPRLVAAQKRASVRFQNLKNDFSVGNIFTLFIASVGVVVFNFFMLIPAFIYGAFLFVAYLSSLTIYGAGIVVFAASISGVSEMEFKLPHQHNRNHGHQVVSQHYRGGTAIVNLSEHGIVVDEVIHRVGSENSHEIVKPWKFEKHVDSINIKNKMETRHSFYGVGLLLVGTGLLLLCIWMTRLTVLGFSKYFMWNLSLLRSTFRTSSASA